MCVKNVVKFETPDGRVFDTKLEAKQHIRRESVREDMVKFVSTNLYYKDSSNFNYVVNGLLANCEELKDILRQLEDDQ